MCRRRQRSKGEIIIQLPKGARDLSGQKFHRLTAIEPIGTRTGVRQNGKRYSSGVYWRCICECGNESKVLATALLTGKIKSCGCLTKESAREIALNHHKLPMDLTGERYGSLTIIKPDNRPHKGHSQYWWCQCDCGSAPKSVCGSHLRSGKIVSCGCKTAELISAANKQPPHSVEKDDEGLYFVSKERKIRFDEEDLDVVTACLWTVDSLGYCCGTYKGENIRLHRAIMRKYHDIQGIEIDHKNGDLNDYRKSNLRLATHAENMKNTTLQRKGARKHKGVSLTRNGTWQADITCDGKVIYIGIYKTFEEACEARDKAELELFGEFSRLASQRYIEEG